MCRWFAGHALRGLVLVRSVVWKLGVIPIAVEREPECSSVPMEKHREEQKPGDQRRHDVTVWIFESHVKNNVRRSERRRRPPVVDVGRTEEVAGFAFEFEIAVAAAFVHANEAGEQLSRAAQRATQPKSPFVTNFQGDACQETSPVSNCASAYAVESSGNLPRKTRSTIAGFRNLTRPISTEHAQARRVAKPNRATVSDYCFWRLTHASGRLTFAT